MNKNVTFVSWKWVLFFFKKGNPIFRLNLDKVYQNHFLNFMHVKKFKIFRFLRMEKKRLAQGICRPKAYAGPKLPTLPYTKNTIADLGFKMTKFLHILYPPRLVFYIILHNFSRAIAYYFNLQYLYKLWLP